MNLKHFDIGKVKFSDEELEAPYNTGERKRYLDEYRPFRINYKSKKDLTIFSVRDGVLCIFFRNDYGWLNVPDEMYNRIWSQIHKKGVTYISDEELQRLSQELTNGEELIVC